MEKRHIGFDILVHPDASGLSDADKQLLERARKALETAYAPYSGFKVGAAVLMDSGEVVIGNNQENASYPSGLCAERVAVFQAGARFPGELIRTIAIVAKAPGKQLSAPAAPCGNCRQSIYEYEKKQGSPIRLLLQAAEGAVYECPSLSDLLPLGFDNSFL